MHVQPATLAPVQHPEILLARCRPRLQTFPLPLPAQDVKPRSLFNPRKETP